MQHIFNLIFLISFFYIPTQAQSWGRNDSIAIVDGDPGGHGAAMKVVLDRNLRQLLPLSRVPKTTIIGTFFPDSTQLQGYSMLSYSHTLCCDSSQVYHYQNHNQITLASHGSNNHSLIMKNPLWPWIRTGTHDTDFVNKRTSYGPGLDFTFLTDTIKGYQNHRPYASAASESFANVLAVARLYYIKYVRDSLCNCDQPWFTIYEAVRHTARNYNLSLSNEGRKLKTGWGEIDVNAAIAWGGVPGEDYWLTSNYQWGDTYPDLTLMRNDTFPRKTVLEGTEFLHTHRFESGGNKEFNIDAIKNYVLKNHRSGVATATTDGSGDITITFSSALPDNTYSLIVTPKGTTYYTTTYHTETTGSVKVRFFDASGAAVTATSVTISYEAKDY